MEFTAKDVKALRDSSGAGMMDCKKALTENDGDMDAAKKWLREKGLAASAKREDRDATQGVVALTIAGNVGAIVELKCETDFTAGSDLFKGEAEALAALVADRGTDAVAERNEQFEALKVTLKENISIGAVERIEAGEGNDIGFYQHVQGGRGVNGVLVEVVGEGGRGGVIGGDLGPDGVVPVADHDVQRWADRFLTNLEMAPERPPAKGA